MFDCHWLLKFEVGGDETAAAPRYAIFSAHPCFSSGSEDSASNDFFFTSADVSQDQVKQTT